MTLLSMTNWCLASRKAADQAIGAFLHEERAALGRLLRQRGRRVLTSSDRDDMLQDLLLAVTEAVQSATDVVLDADATDLMRSQARAGVLLAVRRSMAKRVTSPEVPSGSAEDVRELLLPPTTRGFDNGPDDGGSRTGRRERAHDLTDFFLQGEAGLLGWLPGEEPRARGSAPVREDARFGATIHERERAAAMRFAA